MKRRLSPRGQPQKEDALPSLADQRTGDDGSTVTTPTRRCSPVLGTSAQRELILRTPKAGKHPWRGGSIWWLLCLLNALALLVLLLVELDKEQQERPDDVAPKDKAIE
jgi:hypothetical protein